MFGLLGVVYLIGLFVPLMDSDAAHHANIALHMYQHNNFVDLVDKGKDYLDKPHLLFWTSALSYYIFGVTAFAYKLPSLLFSIAGVWATYRLGTRLYNKETGRLAALLLASAQAFMLACMDVRMDAILTSCIILSVWQLVESVTEKKWYNLVLAALFMGMGFSTKGQVGIVMPAVALFFYLVYKRDLRQLFHPKWILLGLMTIVFMLPVIYCFYLQYDLHPEKNIRGMTNISGVKFILWGQNIERLDGKSWGGGKRDYFFYLHTMLWAFLPWSLIAYYAIGHRLGEMGRAGLAYHKYKEGLTIGTVVLIFVLISVSRFQLPHYLNILFPYFSILSAARLLSLAQERASGKLRVIWGMQVVVILLLLGLSVLVNAWFFPVTGIAVIAAAILLLAVLIASMLRKEDSLPKLVTASVIGIVIVNFLLNASFYPRMMAYQGGSGLAHAAKERDIDVKQVRYYDAHSFAFDFETRNLTPFIDLGEIRRDTTGGRWIFTSQRGLDSLRLEGIPIADSIRSPQYRLTRLKLSFLNPATRQQQLDHYYLVKTGNRP